MTTSRDPWWRSRTPIRRLDPDVAEMLRDRRRELGLTQPAAARQVGCHPVTIARLERGTRAPSLALATSIAATYRLDDERTRQLLAVARPYSGRSSPYRTKITPPSEPPNQRHPTNHPPSVQPMSRTAEPIP